MCFLTLSGCTGRVTCPPIFVDIAYSLVAVTSACEDLRYFLCLVLSTNV
jgi:hypothetical protein